MKNIDKRKQIASDWFKKLQVSICSELESIEKKYGKKNSKFKAVRWNRDEKGSDNLGGGEMRLLRGKVFEKAGVNTSTVFGKLSKNLSGKIPGTDKNIEFWASGISLVIHPYSPKIPAIHMNTRFIVTQKSWFGGGIDITPTDKNSKESKKIANFFFHAELKKTCDIYKIGCYERYKKWCDEYFFLPHRNESRGLGGIFDYLDSGVWNDDMEFVKNIGTTFKTYKSIVNDAAKLSWNDNDKKLQNFRRSRYVEFNLLYDRGTKFGLETNGNIEAIFMSLPPSASW